MTPSTRRPLLAACALLLPLGAGCGTGVAASAPALGPFELCTLAQVGLPMTVAARCATLRVPEDRAHPGGRLIDVRIARVAASAKRPRADPVVMLAGGPGQSALDAFPQVAAAFHGVLRERDVILVDQRGTGQSHPLECPQADAVEDDDFFEPELARELAERCLGELQPQSDPRFYTTSDYVDDLEAVRTALGIERLNLVGISYGTRVALEYVRRHGDRTRSVVLDSVVPPQLILGADHARNLETVINSQFARCEADAACRDKFGSPRARLDALLAKLREHPERVSYVDPLTGEAREDTLTAADVAGVVRMYAYAPQLFGMLPMTLAAAASGDYSTLMANAHMIDELVGEQISMALQLSVSCAEDVPWLHADPRDKDTLLGTTFVDLLQAQCAVWPRGRMPADFHEPVRTSLPVMLLSGELDPVTPPRYGATVQRALPNARHFTLKGQGHSVLTAGCVPELLAKFVATAQAATLDGRCLDRLIESPPFGGTYGWEP